MPTSLDYLISAQHEIGGWGYSTGHQPVVEPTAVVLLTIRDEPLAKDAFQRGINWLLQCQHQDGGWGINEIDTESGWQTAWALIVMKATNQNPNTITRAGEWLSTVANYQVSQQEFKKPEVPQHNEIGALIWPWLPGQAGWIEPTALALLALAGSVDTLVHTARINSALEYFRYFRTASGGWNVGNATKLDTNILPRAYPTALVLMALAGVSQKDILPSDLTALQQDLLCDPGMLAQGAGLLALRVLGNNEESVISRLSENQLSDGSWEHNPFVTAWAVLGLRGYL